MRFADLVVEQRNQQVLAHATPHLEHGEEVVEWARARQLGQRRHGYVFLTPHRLLVVWSGRADGYRAISWRDVDSWGVDCDARGGPVLGVEARGRRVVVHMPVGGGRTARKITGFLRRFARLAPRPRRRFTHDGRSDRYVADPGIVVTPGKRTARDHTKRVGVTLIGLLMIVVGGVISPIPGPWSLPIVLAGLAVLAREYDSAHDLLEWVKHHTRATRDRIRARRAGS